MFVMSMINFQITMIAGCFSAVNVLFVTLVVIILVPVLCYKGYQHYMERTEHARMTQKIYKQLVSIQYDPRRFINVMECAICLEDFNEDKECTVTPLPCSNTNLHVFHSKCINPWLAKEFKCPLCKDQVVLYNCINLKDNFETRYPVMAVEQQ